VRHFEPAGCSTNIVLMESASHGVALFNLDNCIAGLRRPQRRATPWWRSCPSCLLRLCRLLAPPAGHSLCPAAATGTAPSEVQRLLLWPALRERDASTLCISHLVPARLSSSLSGSGSPTLAPLAWGKPTISSSCRWQPRPRSLPSQRRQPRSLWPKVRMVGLLMGARAHGWQGCIMCCNSTQSGCYPSCNCRSCKEAGAVER